VNKLQGGKDHYACYCGKNHRIVNCILFSLWIVKQRKQSHEIIFFNPEYKTGLPILEMIDLRAKTDASNTHQVRYTKQPKSGFDN
jgi:hypothetical protein